MNNFTADLEKPLKRPIDLHDSIMLCAPSEKLRNKMIQLGSRLWVTVTTGLLRQTLFPAGPKHCWVCKWLFDIGSLPAVWEELGV